MRITSALKVFKLVSFSRYMFVLAGLTVAVVGLLVADLNKSPALKSVRTGIMDGLSPLFGVAQSVNRLANDGMTLVSDFFLAFQRLDELKDENQKLVRWKAVAMSLMAENKALREQMNVVPEAFQPVVTARVLTYPSNPSIHRIIIQAGSAHNVEEGQVVVTPKGIIGRILECGTYVSEVLLITDGYSRIPVTIEPIHQQAILAGTQNAYMELEHLDCGIDLAEGMHVFTSGKGGIFPPGLYLGMTVVVNGKIVIEPVMEWKDLDYVQILTQPQLTLED